MGGNKIDHDLYRGTLDIIVLSLLAESEDHGYGLIERLRSCSGGQLSISEGAVYPLLHRMQSKKLIRSEWGYTAHNRKAKCYFITDLGRVVLSCRSEQWQSLVYVIDRLISPTQSRPPYALRES